MSAEYAARMDSLRQQRERIAAKRKAIEKKLALREATAAEFSAVARQTARQKAKSLRTAAVAAKARNDEFVRAVREAQRRNEEARLIVLDERSPSSVALAREKARYLRKIEQVYPAWQEKVQKLRVEKLRALEERKRKLEHRRYLAKKTFEQEQTVEDLIRQTRHEIELTKNLAHNEAYERELLRRQSANHASQVGETIREHAKEARSFLHERASEQLLTIPEVDEETADAIYDTFSPRHALQALREGASAVSIQANADGERMGKPRRQINVSTPSLHKSPSQVQAPPSYFDPELYSGQQYLDAGGQEQGYINDDVPVDAQYGQVVQQAYVVERLNRDLTGSASGNVPVVQHSQTSARLDPQRSGASQTLGFAQTMPDSVAPLGCTTTVARSEDPVTGSIVPMTPSAASLASTAAVKSECKSGNTQQTSGGAVIHNAASTVDFRHLEPKPSITMKSMTTQLPSTTTDSHQALVHPQFEVAADLKETSDTQVLADQHTTDAMCTTTLVNSAESEIGVNVATMQPSPKARSESAGEVEAPIVASVIDTLSQSMLDETSDTLKSIRSTAITQPQPILEEKSDPLQKPHSTVVTDALSHAVLTEKSHLLQSAQSMGGSPLSDSTGGNPPYSLGDCEPLGTNASLSDGNKAQVPEHSSVDLADKAEFKNSSEPLNASQTSLQPSSADHASSLVPPSVLACRLEEKTNELPTESSLIASVDSVGLSPLTSLDLSGSFFRDVEAKATTSPEDTSVVRNASAEAVPYPSHSSEAEARMSLSSHGIKDSSDLESSLPIHTTFGRQPDFGNAEGAMKVDSVVRQEAPCESTQREDVAQKHTEVADTPTETAVQHASAVAGGPDLQQMEQTTTEASTTTTVNEDLALTATIEPTAVTTAASSTNEEPVKMLGTQHLSPSDRVKALGALIARVEEGAAEGDRLGESIDSGASIESKRDLIRIAMGGRKAQIAFYGSDICFELILDIARDIGQRLFPSKAFEGIMNDQKLRKLHQQSKDKETELWKLLSGHLKQLVGLKAIAAADLVDLFLAAFLSHDPSNQRSQRKMREFLFSTCGAVSSGSPSRKDSSATPSASPNRLDPAPSPEPAKSRASHLEPSQQEGRVGTSSLLQTAFLQHQSPPKTKTFGIATTGGYKKKSGREDDFLSSMSSTPTRLSQKLMKGSKLGDYSEFEEEEEVDLQNLIGSRSSRGVTTSGKSEPTPAPSSSAKPRDVSTAAHRDDADFDVDF